MEYIIVVLFIAIVVRNLFKFVNDSGPTVWDKIKSKPIIFERNNNINGMGTKIDLQD